MYGWMGKKKRIKGGREGERETKRERKNPQLPEPDQWQKCAHLLRNGPSRDVVPTERAWTRGKMKGEGDKGPPPDIFSKPSRCPRGVKFNMKRHQRPKDRC